MEYVGLSIAAVCLVIALVHVFLAGMFVREFSKPAPAPPSRYPKAVIRLSLRGADPELAACLRGFIAQDYPDYELHVIVDHQEDLAWTVVHKVIEETGANHVRVEQLKLRLETCSLKCSATVQAIQDLDPSVEVVAFSDGDVLAHRTWLRELVVGLEDPQVGATYGNRWYMPPKGMFGSLVRHAWNAGSVVSIYLLDIPWGGSFAMRVEVIRRTNLMTLWTKAAVEDTPVTDEIKKLGLKANFVPSLMMVNNEECTFTGFYRFIKRQICWTRLYHPNWLSVVLHSLGTNAAIVVPLLLAMVGLLIGEVAFAAWSVAASLIYVLMQLGVVFWLEATVRKAVRARGEPTRWFTSWALLCSPFAVVMAHLTYVVAVLVVQFQRQVTWRGITYTLNGPWDVRMLKYEPFRQGAAPTEGTSIT